MNYNMHTLTHTAENLPLKSTGTRGSLTKAGWGRGWGGGEGLSQSREVSLDSFPIQGESVLTAKPVVSRRSDSTLFSCRAPFIPQSSVNYGHFNQLQVKIRQSPASGVQTLRCQVIALRLSGACANPGLCQVLVRVGCTCHKLLKEINDKKCHRHS